MALPEDNDFDEDEYWEGYAEFADSMVTLCHCSSGRPCDGVLAGGLCDGMRDDDDDEYWYGGADEDDEGFW